MTKKKIKPKKSNSETRAELKLEAMQLDIPELINRAIGHPMRAIYTKALLAKGGEPGIRRFYQNQKLARPPVEEIEQKYVYAEPDEVRPQKLISKMNDYEVLTEINEIVGANANFPTILGKNPKTKMYKEPSITAGFQWDQYLDKKQEHFLPNGAVILYKNTLYQLRNLLEGEEI